MSKILIDEAVAKFALWRLEDLKDFLSDLWGEEDEQNLVALRQALEKPVAKIDTSPERVEKEAGNKHIAAPAQEPVACKHTRYSVDAREQTGNCYDCGAEGRMQFVVNDTSQPQRQQKHEWVGLTDQEIEDFWNQYEPRFDYYSFSCDIEAKLKEKNT